MGLQRLVLAIVLQGVSISCVLAQTSVPSEQKASASAKLDPNAKSQLFGDWQLHCQSVGAGSQMHRSCEITQFVVAKEQNTPLAQLAIGRLAPGEPLLLTVVFPVNVSFPSTPKFFAVENDPNRFDLAWRRCTPGGCFASSPINEDSLSRWKKTSGKGRVVFKTAGGQDLALPVSFQGLDKALEALIKER